MPRLLEKQDLLRTLKTCIRSCRNCKSHTENPLGRWCKTFNIELLTYDYGLCCKEFKTLNVH